MFTTPSKYFIRFSTLTFLFVILGHITSVILSNTTPSPIIQFIDTLFYFGHEKNITALFSAALFIILSYYFRAIGSYLNSNQRYWNIISYIAIFLACDEWFAIHDATLNIYGIGPLDIPIWVWVYGLLSLSLLAYLLPFLRSIPSYLTKSLLFSGFIFISGSAIMEAVTYSFPPPTSGDTSIFHHIGWFFEDGLEMSGVLTMIMAAHLWLLRNNVTHLNIKKWPAMLMITIGLGDMCYHLITNPLNIK